MELARRCGISRGYMSQLMRGERSPSPRVQRRLQEVLGVTDFHNLFFIQEADG
ncbi:MAG: helix-turn-helix transcriptional regulator [Chloroflexota bacterium]|nr:helix-turn-helix transcriptional regulator [Chloroflexota bacterium]